MPDVPVSVGELLDKISILRIKSERLTDAAKLANVRKELTALETAARGYQCLFHERKLEQVNKALWDVEDALRVAEREQVFDDTFVQLARSVYRLNDERSAIKRQINEMMDSEFVEEKSYDEAV